MSGPKTGPPDMIEIASLCCWIRLARLENTFSRITQVRLLGPLYICWEETSNSLALPDKKRTRYVRPAQVVRINAGSTPASATSLVHTTNHTLC
jgi:hypothetical protein